MDKLGVSRKEEQMTCLNRSTKLLLLLSSSSFFPAAVARCVDRDALWLIRSVAALVGRHPKTSWAIMKTSGRRTCRDSARMALASCDDRSDDDGRS